MISKDIQAALNDQINKEFYAAYLYLAMSSYSASEGLPGFANWFRMQYQEELDHAIRLFDYVLEQGAKVALQALKKPSGSFKSPKGLFDAALKHEQSVTRSIYAIVDLANQERDHATHSFLQWFVNEQVEEEATVQGWIDKLKLAGGDSRGLFMIDQELSQRSSEPEA